MLQVLFSHFAFLHWGGGGVVLSFRMKAERVPLLFSLPCAFTSFWFVCGQQHKMSFWTDRFHHGCSVLTVELTAYLFMINTVLSLILLRLMDMYEMISISSKCVSCAGYELGAIITKCGGSVPEAGDSKIVFRLSLTKSGRPYGVTSALSSLSLQDPPLGWDPPPPPGQTETPPPLPGLDHPPISPGITVT